MNGVEIVATLNANPAEHVVAVDDGGTVYDVTSVTWDSETNRFVIGIEEHEEDVEEEDTDEEAE